MRFVSLFIICACLFLAACGGQPPAPTEAPTPEETTAIDLNATPSMLNIIAQTITVPAPGVLSYMDTSGTPEEPPQPLELNLVQLEVRPAGSSERTIITINGDGTALRDGQPIQMDSATLEALRGLIEQINFFNIQGIFVGEGPTTQGNRYYLTVDGSAGSRMITAEDQNTPSELLAIITLIQSIGEGEPAE